MEDSSISGLARLFAGAALPRLLLLRALWPQVVGADVARRTELVSVDGDILRVRVPDPRWQQVLHRMRRQIVVRLREAAGAAAPRGLGFVVGPVAVASVPTPQPEPEPVPVLPASLALRASAAAIADPELRQRFLATAVRALQRHDPNRALHSKEK